MVYDPNNPITPPPGGFAITSVPGAMPGSSIPSTPGIPMPPGLGGQPQRNPGAPVMPVSRGPGLTPGGMPPVPGVPPVQTKPEHGGGFGQMFRQSGFDRDQLRGFIDQIKNAMFEWIQARPQGGDPAARQEWRGQRPDPQSLLMSMFNTPAPVTPTAPPVL